MALGGKDCNLFISYSWSVRKAEVEALADHLIAKKHFGKVWIDRDEMFGNTDERMIEGINEADLVVICFSEAYVESENCMKELSFAANKKVPLFAINVESDDFETPDQILFHIKTALWHKYFGEEKQKEEIFKHICKVLDDIAKKEAEEGEDDS